MRKKSLLTMAASLALVAAVGVGSTLAYFTDQSEEVVNTFTVGSGYEDGDLELKERPVVRKGGDGEYEFDPSVTEWEDWVQNNNYEDVMPGETLPKNPTVKLSAQAVDSYVFIVVDNVDETLAALDANTTAFANSWNDELTDANKVAGENGKYDGVYYIETEEGVGLGEDGITLFSEIKITSDAEFAALIPRMNFRAGAIQSQTFADAKAAYAAFKEAYPDFTEFM